MTSHHGILVALALLVLLPGLGSRDHWTSAEARPSMIARDVLDTGRLFPPHLAGEPYLNKPPLYHGLVAAAFFVAGESTAAARIPAVLAAVAAVLLTFGLARDLGGERAGLWSALFLLGCGGFTALARSSELETMLTAATLLTLSGLERVRRDRDAGRPTSRGFIWAACGVAVATWTKGPMLALLFPALFLLGRVLLARHFRPLMQPGLLWLPAAALAAVALFYLPVLASGTGWDELRERVALGNVLHARGPLYYAGKLPLLLLPALLVLPAMVRSLRAKTDGLAPWIAYAALGVLAFSAFPSKQSHYLLPLVPAVAIWGGLAVAEALDRGRGRRFVLVLGGAIAVGVPVAALVAAVRFDAMELGFGDGVWIGTIAALAGAAAVIARRRESWARRGRAAAMAVAVALIGSIAAADAFAGAALNPERSERAAMERFAARAQGAPIVTTDGSVSSLWYLDRRDARIVTVAEAAAFLRREPDGFVIVEHDRGDVVPPELAGAAIAERWTSPSGKRGHLLLGPGI